MRIGMLTWGSHGDIRPFLALAQGLQAAGHQVSLAICSADGADYRCIASTPGLRIDVLNSPVLTAQEVQQIGATVYTTVNPLTQMKTVMRLLYDPVEELMFATSRRLAADSDLLIGHYFVHVLQTAADEAGVPYASVLLSHAGIPTVHDNPSGLPDFGATGNRLFWWLTRTLLNRVLLHYPNRYRQRLGLAPLRDVLTEAWIAPALTLLAVSPSICKSQPDWPAAVRLCGFLDTPGFQPDGVLPPDLQAFLDAGAAPVYMSFGSWMPKDIERQRATLALLAEAAALAGCRAIIQGPSWEQCGVVSSDQVLYVAAAPHRAVFPHCSAVVHHGGAGTNQATCAAGKPSVVVAHLSEQEHWGRELRRAGIAGKTLRRRSLTAPSLARQLKTVLAQPEMQAKARAIGAAMARENAVATAVQLIEQTFGVVARAVSPPTKETA